MKALLNIYLWAHTLDCSPCCLLPVAMYLLMNVSVESTLVDV